MRKIESCMRAAVIACRNWRSGNTEVVISDGGAKASVYLHGNKIYMESTEGWASFTLAGWNTQTTRSRLRALGVCVECRNLVAYYKDKPINSQDWYAV